MTCLWASELSIAQRLRRPRRGSWPGGWGELGDRCSFLPCYQFRLSEWLNTKLSHTEICWVLVDCLGTLSLGLVCSYSLSFIPFAKIYCLRHCISGLILQKKQVGNEYLRDTMQSLEEPDELHSLLLGDSAPWVCYVLGVLLSKALSALCFRLSCKGCLFRKQSWRIRTLSPSRVKGRHVYCLV